MALALHRIRYSSGSEGYELAEIERRTSTLINPRFFTAKAEPQKGPLSSQYQREQTLGEFLSENHAVCVMRKAAGLPPELSDGFELYRIKYLYLGQQPDAYEISGHRTRTFFNERAEPIPLLRSPEFKRQSIGEFETEQQAIDAMRLDACVEICP